ncbi:MAG: TonB family protein [Bacteroidia bacterium]
MGKIFSALLILSCLSAGAQTSVLDYSMDRLPENYGGNQELKRFLEYHLVYPEKELKEKTEGKVVIGFVVSKEGKVENAKIIERAGPAMNQEAMRLFSMLLWKPASQKGKEIDYSTTITIPFKISRYKRSLKARGESYQDMQAKLAKPKKSSKRHNEEHVVIPSITKADSSMVIYERTDKPARYLYGNDSLQKLILSRLEYPEQARNLHIEGTVFLSMIVETNGFVSNIKPEKGVGAGCNEEAIRLLGETKWEPAEKEGMLVRSRIIYPITFMINNKFRDNAASEQRE